MSNEKLEEYLRVIEPKFNSHLEKGTIEMSNEYYNLLEERMARLINENAELKKQLEENKNPLKGIFAQVNDDTLLRDCGNMNAEINELKNQQQEFIKYLEDEIKACKAVSDLLFNSNKEMKVYKEILTKYKKIMRISDEK